MAKAVLKAGNAPDLLFDDPEDVEQTEDGSGTQNEVPMCLVPAVHNVKEQDTPVKKAIRVRSQQSKIVAITEVARHSKAMPKRKKKSKFVNSCKKTDKCNVSKFYSGKLSNLVTSCTRDDRGKKRLESSSDQNMSHIWS